MASGKSRTKEQLLADLAGLRQRLGELTALVAEREAADEARQRGQAELEERLAARAAELEESNERLQREAVERARAEEALRQREEEFRDLSQEIADGVAVATENRIHWVNRAFCGIFDYSEEEILGKGVEFLVAPEEAPVVLQRMRDRLAGRDMPARHETVAVRKDGARIDLDIAAKLIRFRNQPAIQIVVRDITERKRSEQALRESEARYRAIFEQAADSIVLFDPETLEVVDFNGAAPRNLGYSREEFARLRLGDIELVETPAEIVEHSRRVIAQDETFVTTQRTKSGELRDIQVSARGISIGGRTYVLGMWRDVTERRRAEEALRKSEARYRAIVTDQTELVTRSLPDTTLTFVNEACCREFGLTFDEIVGRSFLPLLPEEQRERVLAAFRSLSPEHPVVTIEHPVIDRNGEIRWVQWTNRAILDEQGQITEIQAVGRDITERRRAEEALRLSEEQYRTTLDSLSEGIQVIDRDRRIVLVNPVLLEMTAELGLRMDFIGRDLFEALPFLPEAARADYRDIFRHGRTLISEERIAAGGQERVVEVRKIPVFEGGSVARVITVIRDITSRRKMEADLRKAEKLESIGLLAGGIAHDYNNLLTGILTNLSLAARHAGKDKFLSSLLSSAEKAGRRAKGLTQQFLTFSKGGAPIKRPVHLAPLLRETADVTLSHPDVACDFALPDDLWPVSCDPVQIGQVVQNLVLNAQQAMPEGGRIEIAAENVRLGPGDVLLLGEGPYVRLTVRDEGVGIPPEHLPSIFDPFFTTREKGTGLGLAAAYSIVRKHGGSIGVQSQAGLGATFTLYLPAAEAGAVEPEAAADGGPWRAAAGRVLVMDDDPLIRKGARRLLRDFGYEVQCAAEGAETLELYRNAMEAGQPFDAVILDLTVERGMGGAECVGRLHDLDPGVRAIVCSGYATDSTMANFERHGFRASIRKPYTIEELSAVLCKVIADADGP